jgi:signal peptide peptidase SppA
MSGRYDHLLSFAFDHPWAITRPMLQVIAGVLARRVAGLKASDEEIQAALTNRKNLPQPVEGGAVAIIPIFGVIAPRVNLMTEMSGGTTFQTLTVQLREAMANKAVKTIVFDIDSPGSNVAGATEFAREVLKARTKKPIIAQVQYTAASGAYWIAACCTEIVAAPSALVGSVGVFTIHKDLSQALEMEGVKVTYIYAGKYKVDGNETEPISKTATADLQSKVDQAEALFVNDISKGRGIPVGDVRSRYGEGRTVTAQEALSLQMIDRIATLDDTLARVMTGPSESAAARAQHIATHDTMQEPPAAPVATIQDRAPLVALEHDVFELQLSALK